MHQSTPTNATHTNKINLFYTRTALNTQLRRAPHLCDHCNLSLATSCSARNVSYAIHKRLVDLGTPISARCCCSRFCDGECTTAVQCCSINLFTCQGILCKLEHKEYDLITTQSYTQKRKCISVHDASFGMHVVMPPCLSAMHCAQCSAALSCIHSVVIEHFTN